MLGCGVFVVSLLVFVGWLGMRYVAGATFRGQAEGMIESALGVDATLGAVRVQFIPSPRIAVYDVELVLADAQLRIDRLDLVSQFGSLARGRLTPSGVVAEGVMLSLPVEQGEAARYLSEMRDDLSLGILADTPAERSRSLPAIAIYELQVVGSDGLWLAADLEGARGKDDFFEVTGRAQAPAFGVDAGAQFAIAVNRVEMAISGVVEARGIEADQLSWVEAMAPGLTLDGRMVLGGTLSEGIQGALTGTSRSEHGSLDGQFEGVVWFVGDQVVLNDLHWQVPAGHTVADATYVVGEGWRIVLEEVAGNRDLIAALLGYFEGGAFAMVPGDDASLHGTQVAMVAPNDAPFNFVSGVFQGHDVGFFEGDRVILDNLAVEGNINGGAFDLTEVSHPEGRASGRVHIDYETSHVAVDWSGEIDLSTGIVGALWPELPPHEASGVASIEAARFSWAPETGFAVEQLLCTGTALEAMIHPAGWDAPAALRNAGGRIQYGADVLVIEQFEAEGVSIEGEVSFGDDDFLLDLKGDIDLSSGLAALFLPETIRSPQGWLRLAEARGHYHPERGLAADFRAEGALEGVAATWQAGGAEYTFRSLNGTVATGDDCLALQLEMSTDLAGPIRFDGRYAGERVEGTLHAAPGKLAAGFVSDTLQPWLAVLGGNDTERIAIAWRMEGDDSTFSARIPEGSALNGELAMAQTSGNWQVNAFTLQGVTEAQSILSMAGLDVQGGGPATFSLSQDDAMALRGHVDFSNASMEAGDFLKKGVGEKLTVAFSGALLPGGYDLQSFTIDILDQAVVAQWDSDGLKIPTLDLNLAMLSSLFPADAAVGGMVTGSVDLGAGHAELMLDSVRLQLDDTVSISRINGQVAYRKGYWLCENLEVQGEGNDFSLNAQIENDVWQGALRGASLDLEGLLKLRDSFNALRPQGGGKDKDDTAFVGRFGLELGTVRYHRGALQNVVGTAHLSPTSLRIDPFSCEAYEGTAEGALSWEYDGRAGVELAMDKVDLRALDDLLFEEPRNVSGPLSGRVSVTFLPGNDAHPLATMSGTIQYDAEEGTYGRMGNATRLLTLLKTTELIRLNLPTLRDDGLTFQASSGDFAFDNGVATVNTFVIRDRSYAIAGEGRVDFAQEETDLQLHVHLLESVSGIVGSVPILRSTVQRFRETAGIRVVVSGSPFSPEFEADRAVKPLRALGTLLTAPFRSGGGDGEGE